MADIDASIDGVAMQMQQLSATASPQSRAFLDTYRRTTLAVGKAVRAGIFEDPGWVANWDVVFAQLYLAAYGAHVSERHGDVPRPWRLAFDAPADLPSLRYVLVGINAHINYDLPQALLAVINVDEFADDALLERRRRDHERIDGVLGERVGAEDAELAAGGRVMLDRALAPLNRLASKRFLREARHKVWHNTTELHHARVAGSDLYRQRLAELEILSAARVADLLAPGQVLLRLAVGGFGVTLPPP